MFAQCPRPSLRIARQTTGRRSRRAGGRDEGGGAGLCGDQQEDVYEEIRSSRDPSSEPASAEGDHPHVRRGEKTRLVLESLVPHREDRPRLVADHTHKEPCTAKIARAGTCSSFYPSHSRGLRFYLFIPWGTPRQVLWCATVHSAVQTRETQAKARADPYTSSRVAIPYIHVAGPELDHERLP